MGFGEWFGRSKAETVSNIPMEMGSNSFSVVNEQGANSQDVATKIEASEILAQEINTKIEDASSNIAEVAEVLASTAENNPFNVSSEQDADKITSESATSSVESPYSQAGGEEKIAQMYTADSLNLAEEKNPEPIITVEGEQSPVAEEITPEAPIESSPVMGEHIATENAVEAISSSDEEEIDVHPEVMASRNVVMESAPVQEENVVETLDAEAKKEKLAGVDRLLHGVILLGDGMKNGADSGEVLVEKFRELSRNVVTFGKSLSALEKQDEEIKQDLSMLYKQMTLMRDHIIDKQKV